MIEYVYAPGVSAGPAQRYLWAWRHHCELLGECHLFDILGANRYNTLDYEEKHSPY